MHVALHFSQTATPFMLSLDALPLIHNAWQLRIHMRACMQEASMWFGSLRFDSFNRVGHARCHHILPDGAAGYCRLPRSALRRSRCESRAAKSATASAGSGCGCRFTLPSSTTHTCVRTDDRQRGGHRTLMTDCQALQVLPIAA